MIPSIDFCHNIVISKISEHDQFTTSLLIFIIKDCKLSGHRVKGTRTKMPVGQIYENSSSRLTRCLQVSEEDDEREEKSPWGTGMVCHSRAHS